MSIFDYRDRIETEIDAKMAIYASRVVNGNVDNQEEYRRLTGLIKGLDEAKGIIDAVTKKMFGGERVKDAEGSHDETQD